STMPGWAGSSWYYLRYMDPNNDTTFCSKEAMDYWGNVNYYAGGAEHATGHLLYVRFWTKFLKDLGHIPFDEPAKKLVNQGMIQGRSNFLYRDKKSGKFVSLALKGDYDTTAIHVDVNIVANDELDIEAFKASRDEYKNAEFILEDGKYICGWEVEKMSKSKYNVVNPDDIIARYGADTLRLYEMFLGPLEDAKPWNTNGIEGVSRFLKKFWNLFHDGDTFSVSEEEANPKELKALHATIKKVQEDIERLSFNTSVSQFMICVNELNDLKCNKRAILEPLTVVVSTYAPHLCEELWDKLGHSESVTHTEYPAFNEKFLVEDSVNYPISINGKMRLKLELPASMGKDEVEQAVLANSEVQERLDGASPKKVIVVPKRIVNIVI
ncbi:MAG: class I tRNA ligase family protein, partial [Flavobacteriales bacterium]